MSATETVKVTFRLNLNDYLKLVIYNYTRAGALLLRLVICLWLALVFSFRETMFYGDWSSLIWSATVAAALLFVFSPLSELRIRQVQTQKNGALLQDTTVELTPEAITSARDYVQLGYKWEAVRSVARTGSAIYVFLAAGNALIVPARAFGNPDEMKRFFALSSEYWRAVHKR